MMESEHGIYKDITDEKEVMDITTKAKHCVIHFYHSDFRRCMIVDKHLEVIDERLAMKNMYWVFFSKLNSIVATLFCVGVGIGQEAYQDKIRQDQG